MLTTRPKDVDEYISAFPENIKKILQQVRSTIKKAAPLSTEVISYGMPAFKLNGILVYFAGYSKHIGLYPTQSGIKEFKKELSLFKGAKGSVQFPLDKPVPLDLITKIVKFRLVEDEEKQQLKNLKLKGRGQKI